MEMRAGSERLKYSKGNVIRAIVLECPPRRARKLGGSIRVALGSRRGKRCSVVRDYDINFNLIGATVIRPLRDFSGEESRRRFTEGTSGVVLCGSPSL
jgi:hypothetical protein